MQVIESCQCIIINVMLGSGGIFYLCCMTDDLMLWHIAAALAYPMHGYGDQWGL